MIVSTLRRDGYAMSEARNGREALEAMHSKHEDLVLLDLMMPEVSGWDVLRVRKDDEALRRIPVIVITAHHGADVPDSAESGVCALLHKPFELSALHELVKTCLAHPKEENGEHSHVATRL